MRKTLSLIAFAGMCCAAPAVTRIGIIGLDTSHSPNFAALLNGEKPLPEAKDFRVTVAYPWGSRTIKSSYERIPKYTEEVKKLGVEIVDSIPALLGKCDCVLLETNDGRDHLAQALEVFKAGKPVFIDKPLAASLKDCVAIVEAAKKYNAKWFTASSLRYLTGVQAARRGEYGKLRGIAMASPEKYEPTHSLFYWYAIHGAEPVFAALGRGCETVCCLTSDDGDVIIGKWADGKLSSQRALQADRKGADSAYVGIIYTEQGPKDAGAHEGYEPLVVRILDFYRTGVAPIDPEETLEIFAYMEAAAESRAKGGAPVALKDVLEKARH